MMNYQKLSAAAFVLALSAFVVSISNLLKTPQTTAQTAQTQWLKGSDEEKFAQIEKHLRGFDHAMAEIGYRYGELYFAGSQKNWDYAKYQAEKIDLIMRLGLERRPKRSASSQPFINEAIPNLQKAIAAKDKKIFDEEMTRFHSSCVACHRAENILYYRDPVERIRQQSLDFAKKFKPLK
ncbi:MAG: hypothetical protein HC846_00580 [Blastocatellia bacterium]|nr:hypothetical protein [Blastocatellia bacterium]